MPKIEEKREEDGIRAIPWQVDFIRRIQKPDRESLAANSILSSTLAIPMAEEATIGIECMAIINHQIDKASLYKNTLPTKLGFAKATLQEGVITAANIVESGRGYKKAPEVIVTDIRGTGAKIVAVIGVIDKHRFIKLIVENGGKDYTTDAKIEIDGGGGTGAKGVLDISGVVDKIEVVDKGEKYTFAPNIALEGGGGVGASAVAKINQLGQLESITISTCGWGYKTARSGVINGETQSVYSERLGAFKKSVH